MVRPVLEHFVPKEIKLLELGILEGGSLLLWRDYFPKGRIVDIDIQVKADLSGEERVRVFQGSQQDTGFLSEVARETAPEGFDIIIDDASHFGNLTKIAFWHLFDNHLKPSGTYVIEDWGTGYWGDWPDGKTYRPRSELYSGFLSLLRKLGVISRIPSHSHRYGMVGFIKELVDEQGAADVCAGWVNRYGDSRVKIREYDHHALHRVYQETICMRTSRCVFSSTFNNSIHVFLRSQQMRLVSLCDGRVTTTGPY